MCTFRSNTLFKLWNSYAGRLASGYFTEHLLATGDLLYQAKARTTVYTHPQSAVAIIVHASWMLVALEIAFKFDEFDVSPSQEYDLASAHCYGRYLTSVGLGSGEEEGGVEGEDISEYVQGLSDDSLIVPAVSCLPPAVCMSVILLFT